jgi:hypothetical protein
LNLSLKDLELILIIPGPQLVPAVTLKRNKNRIKIDVKGGLRA